MKEAHQTELKGPCWQDDRGYFFCQRGNDLFGTGSSDVVGGVRYDVIVHEILEMLVRTPGWPKAQGPENPRKVAVIRQADRNGAEDLEPDDSGKQHERQPQEEGTGGQSSLRVLFS